MTNRALAARMTGNDESELLSVRLPGADEATLAAIVSICVVEDPVCVAIAIEVEEVDAACSAAETARRIAALSFNES